MAVQVGGCWGCGQAAWRERLTCHRGILRLMTRGAARLRRAGLIRLVSRRRNTFHSLSPPSGSSGGEVALVGDGLAGDAQGGDEADPVGVVAGVLGGLRHEAADGVVAAQVAPDLL